MRLLFASILSLSLFNTSQSQSSADSSLNHTPIAINDLIGQGVDQSFAAIITDRLRTEIFKTGAFTVLERQSMESILQEQGFQQTGCVSDKCIVEMGQLLGVSRIIAGTIGKLGQLYTINLRMIDVATGAIVYTTSVDCNCAIEDILTKSVPEIANKIAQRTSEKVSTTTITPSPAVSKSAAVEKARKAVAEAGAPKKKSILPKVLLGIGTAGLAGAGVYFNSIVTGYINEDARLKAEYSQSNNPALSAEYQQMLADNENAGKNLPLIRNACYGLAGACALGFAVTFAF